MSTQRYICLSCGTNFATAPAADHRAADQQCPKCNGTNILKLSPSSVFGFGGGG